MDYKAAGGPGGAQPALRRGVFHREQGPRGPGAGSRVPRRDRRRGPLRRYGALRRVSDQARLVRARLTRAPLQLFRPGGAAARPARSRRELVLPAGAFVGPLSAYYPRDHVDYYRLSGGYLGGVLPRSEEHTSELQSQ